MAYRRQIKTTLSPEQEKILDALCKEGKLKEAVFVREAVLNSLGTHFSEEVIKAAKSEDLRQQMRETVDQAIKNQTKFIKEDFDKIIEALLEKLSS